MNRVVHKQLIVLFMLLMVILVSVPVLAQDDEVSPFPVTIQHKFGETIIPEASERVVSIGYTEQDALLALDVIPVAVRYWYGDPENAIFKWAQDELGDAPVPVVLDMAWQNLNYEAIMALEPDVISAVTSGISEEEYLLLSEIAPVIAQTDDYVDYGMPWQEALLLIGESLGKSEQAQASVDRVNDLFAEVRADNPSFDGKEVAVAYYYDGNFSIYTDQDARGRFFTDLGFVVPQDLLDLAGDSFYAAISNETLDLLDRDLIVFLGLDGWEDVESHPLLGELEAVQEKRGIFVSAEYNDALHFSSVLSVEYALEGVLPALQAVFPSELACDAGAIAVEDAFGVVCVPEGVEKVVALEWTYVEDLLAVGVQPIGVADIEGYNAWVKIPLVLDADAVEVGARQAPNLELIASLQPDLIVAAVGRLGDNYDALNAIAPVIVFDAYPVDITHYEEMVQTFNAIASAVGREAEAETVLAELDAYFADVQTILEDAGRFGETFILSQTYPSGDIATFRLFTSNALGVEVLEKIGFENSWTDVPQQYGFTTVDFEAFVNIEDTNFFYIAQGEYNDVLTASPLWQALPFVNSERAYWLGGDVWLFGGPASMQVLVDMILDVMGVGAE